MAKASKKAAPKKSAPVKKAAPKKAVSKKVSPLQAVEQTDKVNQHLLNFQHIAQEHKKQRSLLEFIEVIILYRGKPKNYLLIDKMTAKVMCINNVYKATLKCKVWQIENKKAILRTMHFTGNPHIWVRPELMFAEEIKLFESAISILGKLLKNKKKK